jgi:diaminopimelate epimerase
MDRPFIKMNGLGNDFIIVDARQDGFDPDPGMIRRLAARSGGIGCDQFVVIGKADEAEASIRFWNPDGGEAGACGNATRCVAWRLMEESGVGEVRLETAGGLLRAWRRGPLRVAVDMGRPRLDWRAVPLAGPADTLAVPVPEAGDLGAATCLSMGNPHAVFLVASAEAVDAGRFGPRIEASPVFPERVNVGFAEVRDRSHLRLRVWERAAGLTRACGSGACAALVAAVRRGLADPQAVVALDGGDLEIAWRVDGHVHMTGDVEVEFEGRLS